MRQSLKIQKLSIWLQKDSVNIRILRGENDACWDINLGLGGVGQQYQGELLSNVRDHVVQVVPSQACWDINPDMVGVGKQGRYSMGEKKVEFFAFEVSVPLHNDKNTL